MEMTADNEKQYLDDFIKYLENRYKTNFTEGEIRNHWHSERDAYLAGRKTEYEKYLDHIFDLEDLIRVYKDLENQQKAKNVKALEALETIHEDFDYFTLPEEFCKKYRIIKEALS